MGDPSNIQESRVKFTGSSLSVNVNERDCQSSDEIFRQDDTSKWLPA
jgi:hypothetical protein